VRPLIIPNYHVILIHFPLALLGLGLLLEFFSFLWRRSSAVAAGRWMILLGTLLLIPATTSGIYALVNVAGHGQIQADSWPQLKASSDFSPHDWQLVKRHLVLNGVGAALALVTVITWLGASDRGRRLLRVPALVVLILAMGLFTLGAWNGGEMVYRQGFGVEGKLNVTALSPDSAAPRGWQEKFDAWAQPMQMHVVLAGLVFAVAAGAMGLSMRRSGEGAALPPPRTGEVPDGPRPLSSVFSLGELAAIRAAASPPSGRFWLFAALLALLTIAGGFYVGGFVEWPRIIDWHRVLHALQDLRVGEKRRMGLHIVLGSGILILSLILAICARCRPKGRFLLGFFSLLLALAMAAQLWMGTLLLCDNDRGPVAHLSQQAAQTADER